ncbi:hypothetical protein MED92_13036 [Oceanospirillum sp. MED92]|uniref:Uncharacterized protein n=1 Tax=Neptuniibacter caesariensis TaxID=207954 RepID=A0A7U8C7L8_NEPCE|nr:hypothetical protein MED92_13036 [Oceanospirillum sp. MED92] [Neptuniibacter caesariensis]
MGITSIIFIVIHDVRSILFSAKEKEDKGYFGYKVHERIKLTLHSETT